VQQAGENFTVAAAAEKVGDMERLFCSGGLTAISAGSEPSCSVAQCVFAQGAGDMTSSFFQKIIPKKSALVPIQL